MVGNHAILSASSSHRWLACPPSALICYESKDTPSSYALEGTSAHALAENKVLKMLGKETCSVVEDLDYYNEDMELYTDMYVQYIADELSKIKESCSDPVVMVEQKLDFSRYVPEGFGTGDAVIVADDVLTIIDLKYGLGVLVESEDNPQMMCYALGALELFDGIYDIKEIKMTVFQPRRDHISSSIISKDDLLDWAENILKPKAELAIKGQGEFNAGGHCQFCKIKATCKKRAEVNLELAKYDFDEPHLISDKEIEDILSKIDGLISWAGDVKEYALQMALSGKEWKGYKLVEGRSNRKYINEEKVAEKVKELGVNPYEKKLLGITAMSKLLGKQFDEVLGQLIEKPKGKPILVKETDKRQKLNMILNDFKEEN